MNEFEKELSVLINRYSIDTICDTPDFMLADYVVKLLVQYADLRKELRVWNRVNGTGEKE